MRKLTYYVCMTIDVFIAGPADEVDFFPLTDDVVASSPRNTPRRCRPTSGRSWASTLRTVTSIPGYRAVQPMSRPCGSA